MLGIYLLLNYLSLQIVKKIFHFSLISNNETWSLSRKMTLLNIIPFWFIIAIFIYHKVVSRIQNIWIWKSVASICIFIVLSSVLSSTIFITIKSTIVSLYVCSGHSMSQSVNDWDLLLVKKYPRLVKEWDVIILTTNKINHSLIKRVIGTPWETIKIEWGKVYKKTVGSQEYVQLDETYLDLTNKNFTYVAWDDLLHEFVIPEDSYFVMWDNRNHSTDSRDCFGNCEEPWATPFITRKNVVGKVFYQIHKPF